MEMRHRILQFSNDPKKYNLLKSELDKLGCIYKITPMGLSVFSLEYDLSENAPYAQRLIKFAKRNDIWVYSAIHYDRDEILQAEWVVVNVGEYQFPEDEYIDTTYDTRNYCSRCGQGKIQNNPFRLRKDFTQKKLGFLGLHLVFDEIFIRPRVMHLFKDFGITGINYLDVLHKKTNLPITNLFQMIIPVIEEQGLDTDELSSVTCKPQNEESFVKGIGRIKDRVGPPFCGRIKYHYPSIEPLKFKANVLRDLPDFVKSQEYFGTGGAATRFMFVRSRVIRLIEEKGIRGLGYRRPVHLV